MAPVGNRVRVAGWGLAFAVSFACGAESQRTVTPTAVRTPRATAPPTQSASATPQPIIAGMAATITAVEAEMDIGILERVRLSNVPCSHVNWPQPACAPDQKEGDPVPRLPFVSCEPGFLTADELRLVIRQVIVGRQPGFFGAIRAMGPNADVPFPLAPYGVVFRTLPPAGVTVESGVLAILDGEGYIISLRTGCRATPEQLLQSFPGGLPVPNPLSSP